MSILDDIRNLGSLKEPKDMVIPRKKMGRILEAARNAPSPGNVQSLEFIVVEDDEKLEHMGHAVNDHRLEDVPDAVIVIADIDRMARRVGPERAREACIGEATCAVQNMRLVAKENELSSFWVSGFNEQVVADQFEVPDGKTPVAIVGLGFPEDEAAPPSRFGMNELFFYDFYGNQVGSFFDKVEWKGLEEEKRIYGKKAEGLVGKFRRALSKFL